MRLKKEKEEREENEFYARITSGKQWLIFKIIVVFCTLIFVISTIEQFVDGPTKKLTDESYGIDKNWEYRWHVVLNAEGYLFTPHYSDWGEIAENSVEMVYSPIFRVGKKLSYDIIESDSSIRSHQELRFRSVFSWFPEFQILLLIPLLTFIFKRQKPWFNFARITAMVLVFPGTLIIILFGIF
jgi:hypothetical protein